MKTLLLLLLLAGVLDFYGCQRPVVSEVPAAVAPLPAPPPETPKTLEAPKPDLPKKEVDKVLWHLRYAHGLLDKKK